MPNTLGSACALERKSSLAEGRAATRVLGALVGAKGSAVTPLLGAAALLAAAALQAPAPVTLVGLALTLVAGALGALYLRDEGSFYLALSVLSRCLLLKRASRRLKALAVGVPPPRYEAEFVQLDTAVTASGHTLRATLVRPRGVAGALPVVLLRTPYGRRAEFGQTVLAEQGFAVLVQDTRGRFGSDGQFVPVQTEIEDGAATIAWLKEQPFYDGRLAVYGISYLGFTAWASVGGALGGEIGACVPVVSQSRVRSAVFLPGGAVGLELVCLWLYLVLRLLSSAQRPLGFLRAALGGFLRGLPHAAMRRLPMRGLDELLTGGPAPFFQDALRHPAEDGAFWRSADVLCDISSAGGRGALPKTHILSGWHDFFLAGALEDYARCRAAGGEPMLTVADMAHWDLLTPRRQRLMYACLLDCLRRSLGTTRATSPGGSRGAAQGAEAPTPTKSATPSATRAAPRCAMDFVARRDAPVAVQLQNDGAWLFLEDWPPPGVRHRTLYLDGAAGGRRLAWAPPPAPSSASYVYDAARPTPARGGPSFSLLNSGARPQAAIERRGDVLVFSTAPMECAIRVVGAVAFEADVSGSGASSFDVVARLCVVRGGVSRNVCEGLSRVPGGAAARRVRVDLGATACAFGEGDVLRVHVCSAAHPRWMRNVGVHRLEDLADATLPEGGLRVRVTVALGGAAPAVLRLPVLA